MTLEEQIVTAWIQQNACETTLRIGIQNYIASKGEIMPDDMFWEIVAVLKARIEEDQNQGHDIENGVNNFFCDNWQDANLIDFTKTYDEKIRTLHRNEELWERMDMSDDSWHDFCDSVILNGRECYEALGTKIRDYIAWNESNYKYSEMYISTLLHDKITGWLPSELNHTDVGEENNPLESLLSKENRSLKSEVLKLKRLLVKNKKELTKVLDSINVEVYS